MVVMSGAATLYQVPAAQDNLVWVLVCNQSGEAAVVDGPDVGDVAAVVVSAGARWTTILNTHTHGDHIGINLDLQSQGRLSEFRVLGPGHAERSVPGLSQVVDEGDEVCVGELRGRVLRTEGHLRGHVSFVFGDVLFCGDTLFAGGCGYLFDGPAEAMFDSLLRLCELPGDTRVCCAHEYTQDNLRFAWSVEPDNAALAERIRRVWALRARGECAVPSSIEEERATNPFLRPESLCLREHVESLMPGWDMSSPSAIFAATRALKDKKHYRNIDDKSLPLDLETLNE